MENGRVQVSRNEVVITKYDMVTSYGRGVDATWEGLLSGVSSIRPVDRFPAGQFLTDKAAIISDIDASKSESLVMQMITPFFDKVENKIFKNAIPILTTTTGEVYLLERHV